MATDLKPLQDYIQAIERKLSLGDATEHTYRSVLEPYKPATAWKNVNIANHLVTKEPPPLSSGEAAKVSFVCNDNRGSSQGVLFYARYDLLWTLPFLLLLREGALHHPNLLRR